ncbi:Uncharacterised protein [Serratia liquefaciens]|nr:Uncharacterised protein [Serratia liquefaciens]
MMDASWAEDPQKRIDFAWRANHLTAVLAKAVMQTLYRQPPAASRQSMPTLWAAQTAVAKH